MDRDRERHPRGGRETERYTKRQTGDADRQGGNNVSVLGFMQERKPLLSGNFLVIETERYHLLKEGAGGILRMLFLRGRWPVGCSCQGVPTLVPGRFMSWERGFGSEMEIADCLSRKIRDPYGPGAGKWDFELFVQCATM